MNYRESWENRELEMLAPYATHAARSRGRARAEEECELRTCFQRDVDRITYSKAFRRLKHKTQVFLQPDGDHYRTRLTHTLEVTRIARTIARALRLNEDLTEAMALAHDLGHTPFGHAGEFALDEVVPGGFSHNEQTVRVVEILERGGVGLNLTDEVVNGALCHTGDTLAYTAEGRILKFADRIAYINHDIDDAVRAEILSDGTLPPNLVALLGESSGDRIDCMTRDVIANSKNGDIAMSDEIGGAMLELREFMFEHVYRNPEAKREETRARDMLLKLYEYFTEHPDAMPHEQMYLTYQFGVERAVCDYIAGMTDNFAVECFQRLFIPMGWNK